MKEKFFPPNLLDTTDFVFIQSCGSVHPYGVTKKHCGCFGAYIAMKQFPERLNRYEKGRGWFYDRCHDFGISIFAGELVLRNLAFSRSIPLDVRKHYDLMADPFASTTWKNEPADVMSWFNDWADHNRKEY